MSAINGIYKRRGDVSSLAAFNISQTATVENALVKSNRWISPPICFEHRKMPLALEDYYENLPFYDESARLAVICDARFDNRNELFDALNISLNERKKLLNSQIIMNAWQKWGRDCPRYLIGDFAFAVWDEREQTLFCARDHIGVAPFYYSLTPDYFIFANDIKELLAFPEISEELDEDFIIASLADKHFYLPDRTHFAAIRRLAPAHSLTVTKQNERLEKYWFPENSKKIRFANDDDYAENGREILTRAVADRLRTEEKVGVHLSGGLDSSGITVLAAGERKRQGLSPPEVYTWQPPQDEQNPVSAWEFDFIEKICEQENLTPQYCPMNAADIFEILKQDPARDIIHHTLHIEHTIQKNAARQGVRLMLSGWGGDEGLSFDGSGYSAELLLRGHLWQLFREGRRHGSAFKFISRELFLLMFSDRSRGLRKLRQPFLKKNSYPKSYVRPEFQHQMKFQQMKCRQASIRSTLIWLWSNGLLAHRMDSWAAHGARLNIKYAYPLLDRRLLEFVAGLPREQFVQGKWRRWIMRKTLNGILPEEICWHTDKFEKLRVEKGLTEVYKALELAGKELSSAKELPSRARYFDMESLMETLKPEVLAERPKQSHITRALQFLDF